MFEIEYLVEIWLTIPEIRSGGGDGEHRNHYTEEVNQPDVGGEDVADANADTAEQLPMSTIADRPAAASQTQGM